MNNSMLHKILLLAMLSLLLTGGNLLAQTDQDEISIEVLLDRDTIGMDEQASVLVTMTGTDQNMPNPRMPTLPMFDVVYQGRSSNIQIVNGVVTSTLSFRYVLIPKKAGTFPISPVSVVHKNRRYTGNDVELTVLQQGVAASGDLEDKAKTSDGNSKDYFLEAVVDNSKPYVNEQITLSLKFYCAVQIYGSPELVEPTTTGFWTELLGNKAPYYQKLNGRNYKVIARRYALFPTQTGELSIGRAVIQANVQTRRKRSNFDVFGDFFGRGEDVVVRSPQLTINVRKLPNDGRPDNFTGTIGKFDIVAQAKKATVEVNQPVSVTVKISGTGNIKSVAEPLITVNDEQFRVYKASSNENVSKVNDKIGGTKIFEEVFIPKRPGDMEIPAIGFNFFDPQTGKYREIATRPIKIYVTKPEGYVASNDVPYGGPDLTISSNARDIRYIKEDIGDTHQVGHLIIASPLYIVVNAVPVLLLAGMIVMRVRREKLQGNTGYARSRMASKEARRRLSKATSLADADHTEQFYAEIYTAVTSYIADKLNISPHGLTSDRIKELLMEKNADEELINKIMAIIRQADFARFASSAITGEDIKASLQEAENVIVAIEGVRFE